MISLLKALAIFQEVCPPVVKTATNLYLKNKYASLEEIQKHIKPHLVKAGLVYTQCNVVVEGALYVETRVYCVSSGEYISSLFPVIANKVAAQDYGSAVSYAKRYSLTGILGIIVANEDDDAYGASSGLVGTGSVAIGNSVAFNNTVTKALPPSTPTSELPSLPQDKYDAMVKFIIEGKIKEVETAIKKYALNDSQKKLLTAMINQSKAEAVNKAAKK